MNQTPAQLRNAAARRLMARRRFREALDVLNEAIRSDPRYAESYDNRAQVFEAMGMNPQAEADRRKVEDLGGLRRSAPSEQAEAPPKQQAKPRQRPAQLAIKYPAAPRSRGGGAAPAMRALGTVLITMGLFLAAGIGIYLALTTLSDAIDGGDDNGGIVNASPTPNASGETPAASDGAPTNSPTPIPESVEQALTGSPFSFTQVRSAWEGRGLTVSVGTVSTDVTGFGTTAADVTLTKAGAEMNVAVLFYDSPEAMQADWSVGDTVTPKKGSIPSGPSPWANRNAIVVRVADAESIRVDARDAFLGIN